MASLYADRPFALITTPTSKLATGTKPTMYEYTASDMALAHNIFLRFLNSIYLQAPHIAKADEPAFVQWALLWCKSIQTHHETEEAFLFPAIAEMSGQPDVMEVNIEQHHAFVPGIDALKLYLDGYAAKTTQYDGAKIVELIDAFGHILRDHLAAEIDTLLGLQRFGDVKMKDLQKAIDKDAEQSMGNLGLFSALPACIYCLDLNYEGDIWKAWPPAPPGLFWACRNITSWAINSSLKFAPCDKAGKLRPLYALQNAKV